MGRNKLEEQRILVSTRLSPKLKQAIDAVSERRKFRNTSHAVEVLLDEHPDVQIEISGKYAKYGRRNGGRK